MPGSRRYAVLLLDVLLILLATICAQFIRDNFEFYPHRYAGLMPYVGVSTIAGLFALSLIGLNKTFWRFTTTAIAVRVATVSCVVVITAVAATFVLNRMEGVARTLPLLQCLLIIAFMLSARSLARLHYRIRQRPAQFSEAEPVRAREIELVVGLNWLCDSYVRAVDEYGGSERSIAGVLGRHSRHVGRRIGSYEVLGTPEGIEHVIQTLAVHGVVPTRVVLACRPQELSTAANSAIIHAAQRHGLVIESLAERLGLSPTGMPEPRDDDCEEAGVVNEVGAALSKRDDDDAAPSQLATAGSGRPAFVISPAELARIRARPYWSIKRAIDFMLALVGIVVMSPAFLLAALVTWFNVGRPILFWQQRPGLCGGPFRLYKFRTLGAGVDAQGMRVPDAERLNRIGRFMRQTRLDELPQLYSILIGDMSIIGPRPLLPIDQAPEFHARLLVRPGLAGWAQVCGGRDIDPADKAALDIWYLRNASLWLDLRIVLGTIPIVLFGERVSRDSIELAWRELHGAGVVRGTRLTSAEAASA